MKKYIMFAGVVALAVVTSTVICMTLRCRRRSTSESCRTSSTIGSYPGYCQVVQKVPVSPQLSQRHIVSDNLFSQNML